MALARATAGDDATIASGRALFEAAFEYAATGTLLATEELRILRANRTLATLVGRKTEEVVGQNLTQLVEDEQRGSIRATLATVFAGNSGYRGM